MMPTCFNVLVYQMDSAQPTMKAAKTSLLDTIPSTEVEQDLDASAFGVSVEDDIISSSAIVWMYKLNKLRS